MRTGTKVTTMPTFENTRANDGRIQFGADGQLTDNTIENAMSPGYGQSYDTVKVHSGTDRVIIGGNGADWGQVLSHHGPQRFSVNDLHNGETDPILATGHNGFRSVSNTELRPQDFVRILGMETTVANAVTSGYLKPAASGRGYEATAKGRAAQATPAAQPQASPANSAPANVPQRAEEAAHERSMEATRQEMGKLEDAALKHADPNDDLSHMRKLPLNAAIGMLVATQREKPLTSIQLGAIASHWGTDPAGAESRINAISAAMGGQFRAMAALAGVSDPEAAAAWIGRTKPDTALSVMVAHGTRGDAKAWLPLLREYKRGVR